MFNFLNCIKNTIYYTKPMKPSKKNLNFFFVFSGRREMSSYLVNNVIENSTCIPSSERVDTILTIVATLVQDQKDGPTAEKIR